MRAVLEQPFKALLHKLMSGKMWVTELGKSALPSHTLKENLMPDISIPIERLVFGNEHWRSHRAIDEIRIYCDLLDSLQARIDSLKTRGKDEELTLVNVQAVISSYAVEIAMKSLWVLDNSPSTLHRGPKGHDLLWMFDRLKEETVNSLGRIQLTREALEAFRSPFPSNRYSMECGSRDIAVYHAGFLRQIAQLLENKLDKTRNELILPM